MKEPKKTNEEHAIQVVHIAVFPTSVVNIIFRHGDLRAIEYRRLHKSCQLRKTASKDGTDLIHIVPDVNIRRALCPAPFSVGLRLSFEQRFPPVPRGRI